MTAPAASASRARRVVHVLPGRLRVQLPGWRPDLLEALRSLPGVTAASASPVSRNVLVTYDPLSTDVSRIGELLGLDAAEIVPVGAAPGGGRTRLVVPAMDRDPAVGHRIAARLSHRRGVRARPDGLTGTVVVDHGGTMQEPALVAEVARIAPGRPRVVREPSDARPLVLAGACLAAAAAGLAFVGIRRAANRPGPAAAWSRPLTPVLAALEESPAARAALLRAVGRERGEVALAVASAVAAALSGSPLGAALAGGRALAAVLHARARRDGWRWYVTASRGRTQPGGGIATLEGGQRPDWPGEVVEGAGAAVGADGTLRPLGPGDAVDAGERLLGGPFAISVRAQGASRRAVRAPSAPRRPRRGLADVLERASGIAAVSAGIGTRSRGAALSASLLIGPRPLLAGQEVADRLAEARAVRVGATLARPRRGQLSAPDVLVLDTPRLVTDGFELAGTVTADEEIQADDVLAHAAQISAAAGAPWARALPMAATAAVEDARFGGGRASGLLRGRREALRLATPAETAGLGRRVAPGELALALELERDGVASPIGFVVLRPRLAGSLPALLTACRRNRVAVVVAAAGDRRAAAALARRAGVEASGDAALRLVERLQRSGRRVALVADRVTAARALAAADVPIALTAGRSGRFPAAADLVVPDLEVLASLVETMGRLRSAERDARAVTVAANVAGALWLRRTPGPVRATIPHTVGALAAAGLAALRLRGGAPPRRLVALHDPRPERWAQPALEDVLRTLRTGAEGLTDAEAARRVVPEAGEARGRSAGAVALDELRAPLNLALAAAALASLSLGQPTDAVIVSAVVLLGVLASGWQEHRADRAVEELRALAVPRARVLRDGAERTVPARDVVPGDVIVLAAGDRVPADGRVLRATGMEVDEAALTGESLPVIKDAGAINGPASRIVLEGSAVVAGSGRVVAFAVGPDTRLGATMTAVREAEEGPLGRRLDRLLRAFLPLAAGGGLAATLAGLAWRRPMREALGIGASAALGAIPEGLPLLVGVGQAAVARRLAPAHALVRRLGVVEALGRVDVACADKTGTMTEGRLAVDVVAGPLGDERPLDGLDPALRAVLAAAAVASPHPDAPGASAHATDRAVLAGADRAGLGQAARVPREAESPFGAVSALHAARAGGRLFVKGAPEVVLPRCDRVRAGGGDRALDPPQRRALAARARSLAGRGLRVLMVAEGDGARVADPHGLTAVGFIGLRDPLRPGVRDAVERCRAAGVRVVMLTGDHPATAAAIAREAGLAVGPDDLLTGAEVAALGDELAERLATATVIARVTPVDKLRVIEALQARGHVVAMTGDGVNDAPALRLADVGVAMGRGGTEVARQAADVVLADDDFATLVAALREGRSFWRNLRRALGLLLGGNAGELGLVILATAAGLPSPLTARQLLLLNLLTDVLPSVAVATQPPAAQLGGLDREGVAGLGPALRRDIVRRAIATGAPALAAYAAAVPRASLPEARAVALGTVVGAQLAQTVALGRADRTLDATMLASAAVAGGAVVAAVALPGLRSAMGLAPPGVRGIALIGLGTAGALALAGRRSPLARVVT